MLAAGTSYSDIQQATGCSRATIAKIAKVAKRLNRRPEGHMARLGSH
jgi:uncharacterized protein YerC